MAASYNALTLKENCLSVCTRRKARRPGVCFEPFSDSTFSSTPPRSLWRYDILLTLLQYIIRVTMRVGHCRRHSLRTWGSVPHLTWCVAIAFFGVTLYTLLVVLVSLFGMPCPICHMFYMHLSMKEDKWYSRLGVISFNFSASSYIWYNFHCSSIAALYLGVRHPNCHMI